MGDQLLWSFNNALFFVILLIIIIFVLIYGIGTIFDIKKIKSNWAEERCNPSIIPFASLFGYNTKENFEFCMGKLFNTYAQPYFGSSATMFSSFTGLLGIIFGSISSLRNTLATLGGGINVIFQEFTERISSFFFRMRLSAIRIKTLIGRMYAILFSVMYMGLSGITGMTSFTNTFLFSFLDTFCFPGETQIIVEGKGKTPIKDIKIGDILLPTQSRVTGLFKFYSMGQPMVKLGKIQVSTNHYVEYNNTYIKAGDHPNAVSTGTWNSTEPLYCLNTSDNKIPVEQLIFLDYDETSDGDKETMTYIEGTINGKIINNDSKNYVFTEYSPCISENTVIKTEYGNVVANNIKIGDKLVTGAEVVGLIRREVNEVCKLDTIIVTPSTLYWDKNIWKRFGETHIISYEKHELISFIVVPNSQIELENNVRIRDYMELCSPDSEIYYSKCLDQQNTKTNMTNVQKMRSD